MRQLKVYFLSCPKWETERRRYFDKSVDITDAFQDYSNLLEFFISSGHLPLHTDTTSRLVTKQQQQQQQQFGPAAICYHKIIITVR